MKIWEMCWAACICGFWLAFTTPRQTMPLVKPSECSEGLTSSYTNLSYGLLLKSDPYSQPVICLRPPSM